MPKGFLDDAKITITCPGCGKKFEERVGRLKQNPTLACPGCGKDIQIEGGAGFDKANKAVDDFRKSIRDIGKRLR